MSIPRDADSTTTIAALVQTKTFESFVANDKFLKLPADPEDSSKLSNV